MGGGKIQLATRGQQDIMLLSSTGWNPFKTVYHAHTNYARESVQQYFTTLPDYGRQLTVDISKTGDLLQQIYVEINLPSLEGTDYRYIYGIGHALIKRVDIEIGGQIIDRHYSDWLNIWSELACRPECRAGMDEMVGNNIQTLTGGRLYVPLQFWFNKQSGAALPLCALHAHDIRLRFEIRENVMLTYDGTRFGRAPPITGDDFMRIYVDYIYLDEVERERICKAEQMEYLIEQVQYNGDVQYAGTNNTLVSATRVSKTEMNFMHHVKELLWVFIKTYPDIDYNPYFKYGNNGVDIFTSARLSFNGHELHNIGTPDYYLRIQNRENHTNMPRYNAQYNQRIYTYSFGLHVEKWQPSGTVNMSRIDDVILTTKYADIADDWSLKLFAVSYNILRIEKGMATLVF
jgi:hypothetical protein